MRSGYKITLGILTIMILVTITVGTSYSYYSIASEQANPNELATTCFEISFSEGSNGSINLAATYPMSDANALSRLTPYNFTVTNTCTSGADINYVVTLNTLTNPASTMPLTKLKYRINNNNTGEGVTSLLSNATPYNLGLAGNTEEAQDINTSYNLATGTLSPSESVTYNLYLWVDESATVEEVANTTFTGRVLVYSYM